MARPLAYEMKTWKAHKAEWIARFPLQYALVFEDEIHGPFKTRREAINEGCKRYGLDGFMVPVIAESESPLVLAAIVASSDHNDIEH